MGIETVVAIAGLALSAAGTAVQYQQGQEAKGAAKDAQHKQEDASRRQNQILQTQQQQNDATAQARMARARQVASLGIGGGFGSTVNTSPLGLSSGSGAGAAGGAAAGLTSLGQ